jgi:hypothetical protein
MFRSNIGKDYTTRCNDSEDHIVSGGGVAWGGGGGWGDKWSGCLTLQSPRRGRINVLDVK